MAGLLLQDALLHAGAGGGDGMINRNIDISPITSIMNAVK